MTDLVGTPVSFVVVPERSAILVEARSSVGPLSFGTTSLKGAVVATIADGGWTGELMPEAHVLVNLAALASGNSLYDAELARRMDVRRHPRGELLLTALTRLGATSRYQAEGELTLHGVTRPISGTVRVGTGDEGALVVEGEQVVDIRDFDIPVPTALMLRIYPDVRVRMSLHLVRADLDGADDPRALA